MTAALQRRSLGASSVELSPLTFGSMRLHERSLDDKALLVLLRTSIDHGITTFHSSSDYQGFARFCSLAHQLGPSLQHVVKLAEPHFGEARFDAARLRARVDGYLSRLGAEQIEVVQWMWRGDLDDEQGRLAGFADQRGDMEAAFDDLRRAGKIGAVVTFPYTAAFANQTLRSGFGQGLAVYLNPVEQAMAPEIARAARSGLGVVAIRPLAAGNPLVAGTTPGACIEAVLRRPGVTTAVVTYSSVEHLLELVAGAARARARPFADASGGGLPDGSRSAGAAGEVPGGTALQERNQ